jgi:alpha-mannosidase
MKCFLSCLKNNVALNYFIKKGVPLLSLCIFFCIYNNKIAAQSRLYLANDDHTDYMWTANETTYDSAFVNMIDSWMANNNATNTNPPDYQTKFNCDGTYWAWVYEKYRTPVQFQNFINQVKNDRMVVPMNPLVITYGCVPAEATIRSMYYAGELQRKYNISFDLAESMENQVMPLGLASIWAGCGAKYSWHGNCYCGGTGVSGLSDKREKEMYWYRGLDDEGVLMKWYSYDTTTHDLGNYAEAADPGNAITNLTNKVNTTQLQLRCCRCFWFWRGWFGDNYR